MSPHVLCSNLPYTVTEAELFEFFSTCGQVLEVRPKAEKGIAFVVLGDSSAVVQALTMDGEEFQGRRIKVAAPGAVPTLLRQNLAHRFGLLWTGEA